MDVSSNALRKETVNTLKEIEYSIKAVVREAHLDGIALSEMRDHLGGWIMIPLLLAKATCLSTLVQLNEQGKK